MKQKLLTLALVALAAISARADEGMWLLKLMEQQHLEDSLRRAGLAIPASELYSETQPSLRECIGIFGGGCTGEVVSADGLILTNHHCSFSYVHQLSTLEHNYMKEGYFAHSRAEELPVPGLTFTFVLAIEDVTARVEAEADEAGADEYTRQSGDFLQTLAKKVLAESKHAKTKGISARIVPYFGGNQFYAFFEQTYTDVRIVANPPYNVGQFGGNTDNWVWPRHNADFAMLRIYADKKGQPAEYSVKNQPLHVKKYLPISLRGVEEGDYTMIMGFPGSTSRYLTASEVRLRTESVNAPFTLVGDPTLAFLKSLMDQSDSLRLLLEDDYFSLGNASKNFGGMNDAVSRTKLVAQKQHEEKAFRQFAQTSGKAEYANIIDRIDSLCQAVGDTLFDVTLYRRSILDQDLYVRPDLVESYVAAVRSGDKSKEKEASDVLVSVSNRIRESVHLDIDHDRMLLVTPIYVKNNRLGALPEYLKNGADWRKTLSDVYANTLFANYERLTAALAASDTTALLSDPLYVHVKQLLEPYLPLRATIESYSRKRLELDKIYVRALCEMNNWTKAPDANFTLRMTYGHVRDLHPRNAVRYDWQTTLEGMFEKASETESDYFANDTLRQLFEAADYGIYARQDGKLPTCFLSDNDITGGNSGSGVLNARGELIGLAFDGNIESLSSDLRFNPALQRCINVDIRYVLFILDKFGSATYVFPELDLRR